MCTEFRKQQADKLQVLAQDLLLQRKEGKTETEPCPTMVGKVIVLSVWQRQHIVAQFAMKTQQ
jgi:hypothetical protein